MKKVKKIKDHEELQAENYLRLEKRVDVLEEKIDKLTDMIECWSLASLVYDYASGSRHVMSPHKNNCLPEPWIRHAGWCYQ